MMSIQNTSPPARREAGTRNRSCGAKRLYVFARRLTPWLTTLAFVTLKAKTMLTPMWSSGLQAGKLSLPVVFAIVAYLHAAPRWLENNARDWRKFRPSRVWAQGRVRFWLINYLDRHTDQPFKRYPM